MTALKDNIIWPPRMARDRLWPQAGGGGAAPFDPTDISDLELYLRGSDLPASGTIASWTDQSGNSRTPTQSTEASKPVVTTVNGNKAARFDGVDDVLQYDKGSNETFGDGIFSLYAAISHQGTPTGGERWFAWGQSNPNNEVVIINKTLASVNLGSTSIHDGSTLTAPRYSVDRVSGAEAWTSDSAVGYRCNTDANYNIAIKDTYARAEVTAAHPASGDDVVMRYITVGNANTNYGKVDVLSLAYFSRYLTDQEHQDMMDFMADLVGTGPAF